MSSRRVSNSRRSFLKTLPTAIAAVATTPALAGAQAAIPPPDAVPMDALGAAQQLIGVSLPPVERESARPLVARNRDNYDLIRDVAVPSETEPAFSFRPPRPRPRAARGAAKTKSAGLASSRHGAGKPGPSHAGTLLTRPASIDDLAFEPVTTLASLLASRQISSTELTKMYLGRLTRHDPSLHCVVTLTEDLALEQAADAKPGPCSMTWCAPAPSTNWRTRARTDGPISSARHALFRRSNTSARSECDRFCCSR